MSGSPPRAESDMLGRAMYVSTRDRNGLPVIDDCNALFASTLGFSREEVVGQPLADFLTESSRAALRNGQFAASAPGEPDNEQQLLARDGSIIEVLVLSPGESDLTTSPRDIRVGLIDITARKQTEAALAETVAQAQRLMDASLDSVIATDRTGRIVEFNPAAVQTFGYTRDDAIGRSLAEMIIPPEVRAEHADGFGRFLETGEGLPIGERIVTTAVRASGAPFPVELTMTQVMGSDGPMFVGYVRDISERFAAEAALRASEERFRALVRESYDVITVVGRDGTRKYVSPSIERVLGHTPESLLDSKVQSLVHPDDAGAFQSAIDMILAGANQTPALELRFRHLDGEWRDFETIGTNLLDVPGVNGIVFNSREITARKAAEAALRESEARFRTAFDHAPIGLSTISADGRFTQVNRSLCDLLGYSESELLGLTFQDITHPDDLDDDLELARRLFSGQIDTYQLEKRYLRKDGHPIWIELTASAVREDGQPRYALAQVQDITGRRNLDLERATLLASERAYTKQLRDLTSMRADFSTMVAHELRSPVAALRMMTSAIGTNDLTPDAEEQMVAAIQGQIDQLDRLVSDVAAAAAAERDDFSVQLHPVSLKVLVSGATGFARNALGDRPFSRGPVPDLQVWCDPERISQVLQNLLENAAKHTPPGTPVELRTVVKGDRVRIEVSDNGPGVPDAELAMIFEKFGRGRRSTDRQISGLGLGLYVSRQIVEAHGTELTATANPNGGATFAFELRVAR